MSARTIIFASAHRYAARSRLGTAYLAEAFASRGWNVLFIEQPTSLFHLLHPASRQAAREKFGRAFAQAVAGEPPRPASEQGGHVRVLNLFAGVPHIAAPGFRSGWTLEHWFRLALPRPRERVRKAGFAEAAAVVFDSPFFFPLARALGLRSVYRYADRMSGFGEVTPAMLRMQEDVFREADLVVHTARSLRDDVGLRTGPTLYLPNGVDAKPFSGPAAEPPEIRSLAGRRLVYSGAMGPWFDVDLLRTAAIALPDVELILLGRPPADDGGLAALPNVHFVGEQPFGRVPGFLLHSQAAMIPFDTQRAPDLVAAINPLKLYEYCAAGLPVVSYYSDELAASGAPVLFYRTPDEFIGAVRRMLREDSPDLRHMRRSWAAEATWDVRAEALEDAIGRL